MEKRHALAAPGRCETVLSQDKSQRGASRLGISGVSAAVTRRTENRVVIHQKVGGIAVNRGLLGREEVSVEKTGSHGDKNSPLSILAFQYDAGIKLKLTDCDFS